MENSQGGSESSGCNVSVTINNGTTSSNMEHIGGGRQLVMITPLPPGGTVRPPFINPMSCARSSGAVITQVSAKQHLPGHSVVLQHSGGPWQVASKLDKVFLKATYKGKKETKKFMLCNVDPTLITSSDNLKHSI